MKFTFLKIHVESKRVFKWLTKGVPNTSPTFRTDNFNTV